MCRNRPRLSVRAWAWAGWRWRATPVPNRASAWAGPELSRLGLGWLALEGNPRA